MFNNKTKNISSFFSTVMWCLSLSWKSSKLYTIIRIIADIATPLLFIATAYVGKHILDTLSAPSGEQDSRRILIFFFVGLLLIAILRMACQKAMQYSQAMQSEIINGQISLEMMSRSLSADLEYFDNPSYYDKFKSASQDSVAVSYILWNVLACVSSSIAFLGAFAILVQANAVYGVVMIIAAVPASITAAKYTKLLYMLSLEQVNEHRQMYYCQSVSTEKQFAQDLRLFNAGNQLKSRYRRIWDGLFSKRRNMTRKRSFTTGILECLPEIIIAIIGFDVALAVLEGRNTVGDYALFTALAGQLWASICTFSSSALQIFDNKLKIENIKSLDAFQNQVKDEGTLNLSNVESIELFIPSRDGLKQPSSSVPKQP